MLVVLNQGKLQFMEDLRVIGVWNAPRFQACLYKNDHTPTPEDTDASFTEADYDGYVRINIVAWSVSVIVAGHALTAPARIVFVDTGAVTPNNIYGYFVWDSVNAKVVWAERLTGVPRVMDAAGKSISLDLSFTATNEVE